MQPKNPSTARSDKRRAELSAIAQKYGFSSWSAMLTAIKNGKATVYKIEHLEDVERPCEHKDVDRDPMPGKPMFCYDCQSEL